MPVMKIRGGDLDLVEYEFTSFSPGENIRLCGLKKDYRLAPVLGTVVVRAPARIHLTVLDMNRFSPDRPGGGGIGFAIGVYCTAEVECTDSGLEIDYTREPILRHFVEAFRQVVGYTGGFKIRARDHQYEHVGLGSTSTILIAVANALNVAVGSPLTSDELRLLLGCNFVEETEAGNVAFGFETGVGPAASSHGGMVVMGDELTLIYRHAFAGGKKVYIAIPASDISSAGEKEFDLLMNKARTLDYRDRELKSYLVLMDLIPALERGDLRKAGDVIWEIEFRGSKRAEVEHHGFEIYRYMAALRDAGLEFVGMSSVGPSIAVITDRPEEEVTEILEKAGLRVAIATEVDNEGLKVHLEERV
ncbi:MAG: beta-ribofuranosylaminobenzene 5-phosphate synthase [Euryarchaeota archaeon]|nr:beta-ribofuranosylaminobenzene 5-phosphate synthase [Euryarchaeota archaeon]